MWYNFLEPELIACEGGDKMSKTNKELAVEVAIAYIESSSNLKYGNGASKDLVNLQTVVTIIKGVHQTLENLDKD